MDGEVWLRVLGPVEVRADERWERPPGPQLRLLLSLLALSAGQVVAVNDLAAVLWDGDHPRSARASIQILITRLRKALTGVPQCAVERYGNGYRLRLNPEVADVHRFRSLVRAAREARDDHQATAVLGEALQMWHGPALADVPETKRVEAIRHGLSAERLGAAQDRFGHLLAAGRHAEAAAEIPHMLASHPLAEGLAGMLMVAWQRCGRQAEALQVFRDLRARLVSELGVEPGHELQQVHQWVLSGDRAPAARDNGAIGLGAVTARFDPSRHAVLRLGQRAHAPALSGNGAGRAGRPVESDRVHMPDAARALREQAGLTDPQDYLPQLDSNALWPRGRHLPTVVVPRQLPTAPAYFAGRHRELESLTRCLEAGAADRESVILTIGGTAGIGKTALALRWAHQVASTFPGGQLFASLHGYDPCGRPAHAGEVLRGFLEALGVTPERIPAALPDRAALYRSALAGRRALIVLDDARDSAHVRPLLPGSPTCIVLITSRNDLAGLIAAEGARPVSLDVLSDGEARQLIANRLGAERVATESDALAELTTSCACLPLALVIAAARASVRPTFSLAALAASLRGNGRLTGLDAGEPTASVQVAFSCSYQQLSEPAARMFRHLGLHPGPDISAAAAASLATMTEACARVVLAELASANLIREQRPGRFTLHDLLREYAADLCGADESRVAGKDMFGHYLGMAVAAARVLDPAQPALASVHGSGRSQEAITGVEAATAWFEAEHAVLQALIAQARAQDSHEDTRYLVWALEPFFERRGLWPELAVYQQLALESPRQLADPTDLARAHLHLGRALARLGHADRARRHLQKAAETSHALGDLPAEARAHLGLSLLCSGLEGETAASIASSMKALGLARNGADVALMARAFNNLGYAYAAQGDVSRALTCCRDALDLCRQAETDRALEGHIHDSLGHAHGRQGDQRRPSLPSCREAPAPQ